MTDDAPSQPTQTADRAATWPAVVPEAPAGNLPAVSPSVERYGSSPDQGRDGGEPAVTPSWASGADFEGNQKHRDAVLSNLSGDWPDATQALVQHWGNGREFGANLRHALTFMSRHSDLDHIAGRYGLSDHPVMLELAAALGRRLTREPGNPKTIQRIGGGKAMSDDTLNDELRTLRAQQRDAQASGEHVRASQLYAKEQALIASARGNAPAVGHSGRTA